MKRKSDTGGWCWECMAFGHFQGCPLAPDEDEQDEQEEEDDDERGTQGQPHQVWRGFVPKA